MNVFLDASAVIYLIEGSERFAPGLRKRLAMLRRDRGDVRLCLSRLTWLEARVRPLRERDARTLAAFDRFFGARDLAWIDIDRTVIELATTLRARDGLRTPDAIQAASCIGAGSDHLFVTGDAGFRRVRDLHVELVAAA